MAAPKSKGRMIRKDVSRSHKIASLSDRAGFLLFMLIPHLNSFGKSNGSPHFIKGEVVPLISRFTVPIIESCLQEISDKTNVKWFECGGLQFIHSINWEDHQKLEEKKRGSDDLPSYGNIVSDKSPTTPRLTSPEVEVKGEVEVEVKVQGEGEGNSRPTPEKLLSAPADLPSLWNRICISLPKCSKLTEKRMIHIKARMKERPLMADWESLFQKIEGSPFLTGQNDRNWKADFEWIIKSPDNAVKVLEGKYDGGKNGSGNQGVHGSSAQAGNVKAKPGKYAGIGTSVCTDAPNTGGDAKTPAEGGGIRGSAEKVS